MLCELSAFARNELSAMAYAKWSEAYDNVKKIKALEWHDMKNVCPANCWDTHKELILKHAMQELERAKNLKDEICKYSPIILGE